MKQVSAKWETFWFPLASYLRKPTTWQQFQNTTITFTSLLIVSAVLKKKNKQTKYQKTPPPDLICRVYLNYKSTYFPPNFLVRPFFFFYIKFLSSLPKSPHSAWTPLWTSSLSVLYRCFCSQALCMLFPPLCR